MNFLLTVYTDGWLTVVGNGEVFATGVRQPGSKWVMHSQDGSTVEVSDERLRETFPDGYATQDRMGALFATEVGP